MTTDNLITDEEQEEREKAPEIGDQKIINDVSDRAAPPPPK